MERQNLGGDDYRPASLIKFLFRGEKSVAYTYLPASRYRR